MVSDSELERLACYVSVEQADRVAVLRATDDFVHLALDLESKRAFLRLFDELSASPDVGVVLLTSTPVCFSVERANHFWRHVLDHDDPASAIATPHASRGEADLHREETGLQQLALRARDCPKAVVIAFRGEVVAAFLGLGLVADYRIVADDTVFRNRNHALGMPPGGALTYLLPAYIGFGRASELLLEGRDITADEALGLGLVNRVVPAGQLDAESMSVARRFAALPGRAVATTKKLLSHALHALGPHFELETQQLKASVAHLGKDDLER